MARKRRKRYHPPGTQPGTLSAHAEAGDTPVRATAFRYDAGGCEERTVSPAEIPSLSPPEGGVLWLDVSGLSDPSAVRAIGDRFGIHPLALEDVLNVPQRSKVEWYGDCLLVVLREVRYPDPPEQVSFFLADRVVVSFQERPGDAFEPVRERLRQGKGRIRAEEADFLLYSLCDAVLDAFFPTLERLGDEVEEMEERLLVSPVPETFVAIRRLKRALLEVRHAVWPARDALNLLLIEEHALIRPGTKVFFRDCYDHTIQLMDMVETFREMASGLVDEYMSAVSNRMNEIMKVLTVVATIFIPLTFIVGLYGMNFDTKASPYNMPELSWAYGYPALLLLMAAVAGGMLYYFRRKKWL
ncbi:MAG: magnesium and cobalt transport protein CorA [Deltaproteobacteria bacterium]|nr:magnesium and cobalt transport protein CorA [Deltaproteobacteria bacterium]MBS1244094.1 magnesium and cobalt transport protein CorA [Deltaproteobacteria bacterium]